MKVVHTKHAAPGVPHVIEVRDDFKEGGQAYVFFSRDGRYAVKIYKAPSEEKERKLQQIGRLFSGIRTEQLKFILPPLALVATIDGRPCIGFVMRCVPPPLYKDLINYVRNEKCAEPILREGRWESCLRVAISVANCIAVLHGKGCAHGDIHYKNFLVDFNSGDAVMLEIDGVIIEGFMPAEVLGMPGFIAPEVLTTNSKPNLRTDYYSLAVLTLHTLLFRNVMQPQQECSNDEKLSLKLGFGKYAVFSEHPKDDRNRLDNLGKPFYKRGALSYKMLPPRLQRLTNQALMLYLNTPEKRPSSHDWLNALTVTLDELAQCSNCRNRWPYPYWQQGAAACPFCGEPVRTGPLVLRLFEEGVHSEYRSLERALVLEKGTTIYRDITHNREPVPLNTSKRSAVGFADWNSSQQRFRLVNDTDECWTVRSMTGGARRYARKGEGISLEYGDCVQFGPGQRLGVVMNAPRA